MKLVARIVGGIFLAIITLMQIARIYTNLPVALGDTLLPMWVTWIFMIITLLLTVWMFVTAVKK
ncbi:MAG: hypothetical protein JSR46_03160 [Verrucomicrobia bacterium]|nr:hypothetical protein [Verrucomicrobiota bacterium]